MMQEESEDRQLPLIGDSAGDVKDLETGLTELGNGDDTAGNALQHFGSDISLPTVNDNGHSKTLEEMVLHHTMESDGQSCDGTNDLRGGIDLQWKDIECFVGESKEQGRVAKFLGMPEVVGPPTKQIVKGASGVARAGEVLAVMGPSGSGKTTLLNVLAQRPTLGKRGYWKGDILLNGAPPWKDWQRDMSYVMQKDIFYDELKVYENLLPTALLRLPTTWRKEKKGWRTP